MADLYLRSTDGNNTDNGSTWALAKATLAGAATTEVAGDKIWVSKSHSETIGADIAFDGSGVSPTWVCGVDDTGSPQPPTTIQTGASLNLGAHWSLGGSVYWDSLTFTTTTGTSQWGVINNFDPGYTGGYMEFRNCLFDNQGGGTGSKWYIGSAGGSGPTTHIGRTVFKDCQFKAQSGNAAEMLTVAGRVHFQNCSIASGHNVDSTSAFISAYNYGVDILVDGFDFTNWSTAANLVRSPGGTGRVVFNNCKMPSTWSGQVWANSEKVGYDTTVECYNLDTGATNYKIWIEAPNGTIKSQTSVYNDAGASDGTTRIAWQMVTNNNSYKAIFPMLVLQSPPILVWNETTGSAKTLTVEIVHNSQGSGTNGALKDDEIWIEAQYLGTSGGPAGNWAYDSKATVISTAADQASSSASWTGDSAGWDTQKLNVTVTPQLKGWFSVVVKIAKPNITVYVDPMITVT